MSGSQRRRVCWGWWSSWFRGQDVEPDPQREGKWREPQERGELFPRLADRPTGGFGSDDFGGRSERLGLVTVAVKTSSQRRDGYKAHIALAEPDTGIVTACEITGATTADGPAGVELLGGEPSDTEVIADSAYGSGEVRAKLRAGWSPGHHQTHRAAS